MCRTCDARAFPPACWPSPPPSTHGSHVHRAVGVGPERPVDLSVGGFLWPALRTGRATFTASGSPRTHATDVGCRLSVQLVLDPQYPRLGYVERRRWCVGVHRRPPGIPVHVLRVRCPPSPCGRLSRPRTTTRAPPHLGLISRRRTCPPPPWLGGGEGDPEMVPTFTMHRSTGEVPSFAPAVSPHVRRRPSVWPPHRHSESASESTTHTWWSCTADRPTSTRLEPAARLRSFTHWFKLRLHLPVSLAGPGPSGGADPSRRCRGCSHPHLRPQAQAAPSFKWPAATGQRWSPFTSTRYMAPRGAPERRARTSPAAEPEPAQNGMSSLAGMAVTLLGRCVARPRRGGRHSPRSRRSSHNRCTPRRRCNDDSGCTRAWPHNGGYQCPRS